MINIKQAKKELAASGQNTQGMTDDEVISALKAQAITAALPQAQAQAQAAPSRPIVTASAASDTLPQQLVDVFMQSGVEGFKQAIAEMQEQTEQDIEAIRKQDEAEHIAEIKQAKKQSSGPMSERVVTRTVIQDASGQVVTPIINAVRIDEKPACEIWPELPASATYTFPVCDHAQQATFYDMRSLHDSGALNIIAGAQHEGDDKEHLFLHGERGTGKTSAIENIAQMTGRPFFRIGMFAGMEPLSLIGGFLIPEGKSVWSDGVLTQALRTPNAVICIDEPDLSPETCELIQTIIDKGSLTIADTGEVVHMQSGINWFAAANSDGNGDSSGRYEGVQTLNSAFMDRFSFKLKIDFMLPVHEIALIQKQTGCSKVIAEQVVDFANRVRSQQDIEEPVSLRRLIAVAKLLNRGTDEHVAFETAVFSYVRNEADCESYKQLFNAHFDLHA